MNPMPRLLFGTALVMLAAGLLMGCLAALWYVLPEAAAWLPGFEALRPMHVSYVIFWILTGATSLVTLSLEQWTGWSPRPWIQRAQLLCWWIAIAGVTVSYLSGTFGGREYWEFPPALSGFIAAAWLLFLYQFIQHAHRILNRRESGTDNQFPGAARKRISAANPASGPTADRRLPAAHRLPVYVWMWMTGSIFFLFTFAEGYLWLFPWFRDHLITDITVQWKSNGSLVGSWNQLIYGTAFYLMDRMAGRPVTGYSRAAFAMYFLGLFNLMFNWGHHVYPLPGQDYVRLTGYAVSMTEWVFFIAIVRGWKKSFHPEEFRRRSLPYRFLMAADFWVFLNLALALVMSVPAFNLYTHGTHVTVAHAMGATIGINTMILLGAGCYWLLPEAGSRRPEAGGRWREAAGRIQSAVGSRQQAAGSIQLAVGREEEFAALTRFRTVLFFTTQVSLLVFWFALLTAGILRGLWRMDPRQEPFAGMMRELEPLYWLFFAAGIALAVCLAAWAILLLRALTKRPMVVRTADHSRTAKNKIPVPLPEKAEAEI